MLKRSKRIHGRPIIQQILTEGDSLSSSFFVTRRTQRPHGQTRYAVLVGKKIARSAVLRNHKRRQVFEAIQAWEKSKSVQNSAPFDIILIVRQPAMRASYEKLRTALFTHFTL